jgi:hypothetical protein
MMKKIKYFTIQFFLVLIVAFLAFACGSNEQTASSETAENTSMTNEAPKEEEDKSKRPSPPAKAEGKVDDINIVIDYSQPATKGRTIFGDVVPYGEIWRTGANEATTISFDKDVFIEGQKLVAGTYSLFTIPNEKEWTVIFNKNPKLWGAFEYKQEEDALRVNVKPSKEADLTERFTITVEEGGVVTMKWENTKVSFKVTKA